MVDYKSARLNVANIVRNILSGGQYWLSTSTRGVENEVVGYFDYAVQTVRGITLILENGKKVVWTCPKKTADSVIFALQS